jgi:hypothetical protein
VRCERGCLGRYGLTEIRGTPRLHCLFPYLVSPNKSKKDPQNDPPERPKSLPGGPRGTQNRSREPPGAAQGRPGPPGVDNTPPQAPPEAEKGAQKDPARVPREGPGKARGPPKGRAGQETVRAQRFRTPKIAAPFLDRFWSDFRSIFGHPDPHDSMAGPYYSPLFHFSEKLPKKSRKVAPGPPKIDPKVTKIDPKSLPTGLRRPAAGQKRRATGDGRRATGIGRVPSGPGPPEACQGSPQVSRAGFPYIKAHIYIYTPPHYSATPGLESSL